MAILASERGENRNLLLATDVFPKHILALAKEYNENPNVDISVIPTFWSKIFYPDLLRHAFFLIFFLVSACVVVVLRSEVMTRECSTT